MKFLKIKQLTFFLFLLLLVFPEVSFAQTKNLAFSSGFGIDTYKTRVNKNAKLNSKFNYTYYLGFWSKTKMLKRHKLGFESGLFFSTSKRKFFYRERINFICPRTQPSLIDTIEINRNFNYNSIVFPVKLSFQVGKFYFKIGGVFSFLLNISGRKSSTTFYVQGEPSTHGDKFRYYVREDKKIRIGLLVETSLRINNDLFWILI